MRLVIGEGILGNKARPSSGWTLVAPTEAFDLATEASECIAKKGEGASAISGNKEENNKWALGINVHARAVSAPT